jgi:hypothetical protein
LVSSCAHPRCSPSIPAMFPVLYLGRNIPTWFQLWMLVLGLRLRCGLGLGWSVG